METDLSALLPLLRSLPPYLQLRAESLARDRAPVAVGLLRSARPALIAALAADAPGPIVVLVGRNDRALALRDEIAVWNPRARVLLFAEPAPLFYEPSPWGPRTVRERVAVLAHLEDPLLAARKPPVPLVVVTSARAWMIPTLPRQDFLRATRPLATGTRASLDELARQCTEIGYSNEPFVLEPGQFSRRGGILDVWPPGELAPARAEFFGDVIETLRRFDPSTQRSHEESGPIRITPAREALPRDVDAKRRELGGAFPGPEPEPPARGDREAAAPRPAPEFYSPWIYPSASLLDHAPADSLIVLDDFQEVQDTVADLETQAIQLRREAEEGHAITSDAPPAHLTWDHLREALEDRPQLILSGGPEATRTNPIGQAFSPGPRFGGQLKQVLDHLTLLRGEEARVVVVSRQASRLAELWRERDGGQPASSPFAGGGTLEVPRPGQVAFVNGALQEGFVARAQADSPEALHLLTDGEVFGWVRPEPRRRLRAAALPPEADYADLRPGSYVVHVEYGIGLFAGLVRRTVEATAREYLQVEFGSGDQVYVPVHHADRLTRYVGPDERPPALSRLGTAEWTLARDRAKRAVEEIARELLDLYARRQAARGIAYAADTPWQRELEASFPYIETEDQLKAIEAVKHDMETPRPMDRLICGDVGYGKTEVALRAAFKAVMAGKQVAVLVPTTLLAQQHYQTFLQRLMPYPARVEMLSRFRSPAEQAAVLTDLMKGQVDIVIGTHRLLQRDVAFRDLGLVVIDEEQRFGVAHKEYLKRLRTEVDVLTLTATPIPRTLYLSLSGVRDISTIDTPPQERLPVITYVGTYAEATVRKAILREIDRGGQVFYVHNRVETILTARQQLGRLVPEARWTVAHGQMPEGDLERAMEDFLARRVDVLLCTSIIESGLDIPSANTLIVDRADTFGLAQLYQLRGRVGRSAMRGYAYFLTDRHHHPTAEARERLQTLAEQTELGAGYSIAMRDLEIRGAGEILGARQHGHIAAIGFQLYTRLLAQAVRRLKDEQEEQFAAVEPSLVTVDLPLDASLPEEYVPNRDMRLRLYRRMAEIGSESEIDRLSEELEDRFGVLPGATTNLLYQLRIKVLAQRASVESVAMENGMLVLRLGLPPGSELEDLPPGARFSKGTLYFPAQEPQATWKPQLVDLLTWLISLRPEREPEPR